MQYVMRFLERRTEWNALTITASLAACLIAVPIVVVLGNVFLPAGDTWEHLARTVLAEYISNTLWLMLGVGAGVTVVGVATAWLTTMCRFPGRGFFQWALILPLAVPAYVMAYAYTDFFQFTGPVQSALRTGFGWKAREYWFPEVRSLGGAAMIFTFVFYPYVYLLARAAFLAQGAGLIEVGRSLGYGPWRSFFRLALPLARPGIAAGVTLALMETLADLDSRLFRATDVHHRHLSGMARSRGSRGRRPACCCFARFRRAHPPSGACRPQPRAL